MPRAIESILSATLAVVAACAGTQPVAHWERAYMDCMAGEGWRVARR